jgi:hypothetical protein
MSYNCPMKRPISVTLSPENLLWLRAQASRGHRSVSETLDRLLDDVRSGGRFRSLVPRSAVGLVRISPEDPELRHADESIRELFARSMDKNGGHGRSRPTRRAEKRVKK